VALDEIDSVITAVSVGEYNYDIQFLLFYRKFPSIILSPYHAL